jgi:hypothetical protein
VCGSQQLSLRLHAAGNGVALKSPAQRASQSALLSSSSSGVPVGGAVEPCEAPPVDILGRGPLVHVPHTLSASFCQQIVGPLRAQVTSRIPLNHIRSAHPRCAIIGHRRPKDSSRQGDPFIRPASVQQIRPPLSAHPQHSAAACVVQVDARLAVGGGEELKAYQVRLQLPKAAPFRPTRHFHYERVGPCIL